MIAYRRMLARFVLERRSLRAKNLLDIGNCRVLANLEMGYQLEMDARSSSEITRYLQPSPSDLAITASSFQILSNLDEPTSILIGAEHLLHAMNLLAFNKRGKVHVVEPRNECHRALDRTLAANEGLFSEKISHVAALGSPESCIKFARKAPNLDCLVALGGDSDFCPWNGPKETERFVSIRAKSLEEILGELELMSAHLLLVDAPSHLGQILPGLQLFWLLNPLAHVIARLTGDDEKQWQQLQQHAMGTGRRIWALPAGQLLQVAPQGSKTLWITPSGV